MKIEIKSDIGQLLEGEALAACVFADAPHLACAEGDLSGMVANLVREGEFKGEEGTSLLLHTSKTNGPGTRHLFVGLGPHEEFDPRVLRRAAAVAVRRACESHIRRLCFIPPSADNPKRMTAALVEGAVMGLYDNSFYQKRADKTQLEMLTIISPETRERLSEEIKRGRIVAEAVNWARELADRPGGTLPPREFARCAAEMAEEFNLTVETLSSDEVKARGMGGLWGVGKGSAEPPSLIVLRYEPEGVGKDDELWAFVGKGITFDTGGISLKHGLDMYEMKTDMAGGAAVLGSLRAIAQLKPRRRIVGIVPSAENMPSGRAIKPGDVIKTLAGLTIEVVDTDAEGRLVLADGITFAKQLGAARIVDLATLTGSIIVALGDHRTGLFGNEDEWTARVEEAAGRAGEPVWRMPMSDEYKKGIESPIADYKNYGGRPDATSAALLLSKFAGETPWVHLDIAGTSWLGDPQPHAPKGSTGTGVSTLVELVCG